MLTETRKASAKQADDLALYALAQARVLDVKRACDGPCKDCPGPGMPDGCETRKHPKAVAGRADWPMCPLGMLRVPAWQDIVDMKLAARVSPIHGFPDCLTAGAFRGLLELHDAVAREDERQVKEASGRASTTVQTYSGRRSARDGRG